MKIIQQGETLCVTEIEELAAANSHAFQSEIGAALAAAVKHIEIDLSRTNFVDCGGVGALIALRKCARSRNTGATIRLLNPTRLAARIFQLIRIEEAFPVDRREIPAIREGTET